MKQVVQNYKSGELALLDVPAPACRPGGVLVRTCYSLISTGTEMMKVSEASMSLLGKARARPDQVAKVLQSAASAGPMATYRKVTSRLDSYTPLGYSCSGVVEQVGAGVVDVSVGDLVACGGNEHAWHSELNWVPTNLYRPVPAGVTPRHAAFATVGSIALQGVRQGEPQLGEVALVIGLGLIGQLVVQLLTASGVRVVGVDPAEDRCRLAERLGASACGPPDSAVVECTVADLTAGHGVDHVFLAAGGSGNGPVELAAKLSRDRGRVVDIGKCSLNLPWNAYYEKELDLRFSRSYGPGRYDPAYELEGRDYPIGYVRWTERRNLECVLDLLARRRLDFEPLISHVAEFDAAVETYRRLQNGDLTAVAVLFSYPTVSRPADTEPAESPPSATTSALAVNGSARTNGAAVTNGAAYRVPVSDRPHRRETQREILRVGFIGAGNYATSMLLPHLAEHPRVELRRVVTATGLSSANAVRRFGFALGGTDVDEVLTAPDVDAVFVVTRHSSHAELTCRALRAGKTVFVEKPLALSAAELDNVLTAIRESGNDRLHVGFNRRFAPLLQQARQRFGRTVGPSSVRYLINAGRLDAGSWYANTELEGSRFDGEGGHFIDTVSWWLQAAPCSVYANSTPGQDDLQILLRHTDGSTAAISYLTSGSPRFPKETIETVADGTVLRFDDFRRAAVHGTRRWRSSRRPTGQDKGQRAQLEAFVHAARTGAPMPVPVASLVATTRATLAVRASLRTGLPVSVSPHCLAPAGS